MTTMEVKGITWVGNIYQKFENMCLEAEEIIYEDTVKYLENQLQTVGESVKKFYADVMQDLRSPSSCDLDENVVSELLIDQDTDVEVHKKSFLRPKERSLKVDIKRTIKDIRINHDVHDVVKCAASYDNSCDTDVLLTSASGNSVKLNKFGSHARQRVRSTNRKCNLAINETLKDKRISPTKTSSKITSTETETHRISSCDKKISPTKTSGEITSTETETCRISSCDKKISLMKTAGEITSTETETCRISSSEALNVNHEVPHHHAATISNPSSAEVTMPELVDDCCNEIENASAEQIPDLPVFVKSDEEKETDISASSSAVQTGDPNEILEGWDFDVDSITEKGHKTTEPDDRLKLEQSCVMVNQDELQLVPMAGGNLRTKKKKMRKVFTLGKKCSRKKEYEQLAAWHEKNEEGEGDCVENSFPDSAVSDQKKLLLPDNTSEPDWELL